MKKIILPFIFIGSWFTSNSQTVTWSPTIANIFYSHCTKCHNNNGIAPFPLMSYDSSYQHRYDIKIAVANKIMPPWPPDASYRVFAHQRVLTQQQINDIVNWVNSGALEGDTSLAPTPPTYGQTASLITNPDLVLKIPNFPVNVSSDIYQCFVLPTNIPAGTYLKEIQVIPGDPSLVHHVLVFEDTSNVPAQLDSAYSGPGYLYFGGTGSSSSTLIFGYTPGQLNYEFPPNMGVRLAQNTNIVLQIHYPAGAVGIDSTKVIMKFATDTTSIRNVSIAPLLGSFNIIGGDPLFIPADSIKTFRTHLSVPFNTTILTIFPHMHLIGHSAKSYAVTPANDTIPLIYIPDWDFHWQGFYQFPRLLKIPAGSNVYGVNVYDNTVNNPDNPNNPPQDVSRGFSTTDEMLLYYFFFTGYQPGDENIIVDSSTAFLGIKDEQFQSKIVNTVQLYDPFPNPANLVININYFIPNNENTEVKLETITGKVLQKQIIPGNVYGYGKSTFSISSLSSGIYLIVVENNGVRRVKKFVKP